MKETECYESALSYIESAFDSKLSLIEKVHLKHISIDCAKRYNHDDKEIRKELKKMNLDEKIRYNEIYSYHNNYHPDKDAVELFLYYFYDIPMVEKQSDWIPKKQTHWLWMGHDLKKQIRGIRDHKHSFYWQKKQEEKHRP